MGLLDGSATTQIVHKLARPCLRTIGIHFPSPPNVGSIWPNSLCECRSAAIQSVISLRVGFAFHRSLCAQTPIYYHQTIIETERFQVIESDSPVHKCETSKLSRGITARRSSM